MIKRLRLNNFRLFKNTMIEIGSRITVIAGHNATGKSTLLGIIGNACELKTSLGRALTGSPFRTEFSELFKGSPQFDKTGSIGSMTIGNGTKEIDVQLRVAWQTYRTLKGTRKRFRIIPKWPRGNRLTEGKYPLPSLYLGLSRLYPLGEASIEEIRMQPKIEVNDPEDQEWLFRHYQRILSLISPIKSVSSYRINRKVSGGVNTDAYDYWTNSSGQDNLTQILYALHSFRMLRKRINSRWLGGILLIDELDATLHPAAQIRLFDLMLKVCEETEMQVVFTTHSPSLLEHASPAVCARLNNAIMVNYLSAANGSLEVFSNPDMEFTQNDMMVASSFQRKPRNKVLVYAEDAETRWFLENLLRDKKRHTRIVNMNFGADQALSWLKSDPEYFTNILFVLDGDARIETPGKIGSGRKKSNSSENVIKLPGGAPPERVLYDYLISLDVKHEFLLQHRQMGLSTRYFEENGPDAQKYRDIKATRDRNKRWFSDNKDMFEETGLFKFWAKDNENLVGEFLKEFERRHAVIARRTKADRIRDRK